MQQRRGLVLPSDWCGSTKSQRPFHLVLGHNGGGHDTGCEENGLKAFRKIADLQKNKKKKQPPNPKNKPNQLKNSSILEKKCLITMPASFKMLFEGFGLSDSSKISSSWRQSLLVMSTKHFSMWLVLPAGRQYGISTRDCTGTWKDLFSTILTCWVALEKLLLSKP